VLRLKTEYPLGLHGPLVASCTQRCEDVHLTDTATGRERIVRGPAPEPYEGAFSPDGRFLAVPTRRGAILLVDVAAGTARRIPGARMAATYKALAWASSGWLFYNAGRGRLGAWRPGMPARVLPVTVGPFVDMASD
jgi:hypothetical protein